MRQKKTILLPKDDHFTTLIIQKAHKETYHLGVPQTLTTLRQNFWIPKGRITVKSILNKCNTCKRIQTRPYKTPDPPDLPTERVTLTRPFKTVGIDYTGALTIKLGDKEHKVYIVLFTCASSRAVSLDIVEDLTANSFISAFRRFCAKHSTPTTVWTDNALYFKAGEQFLKQLAEEQTSYSNNKNINWKYIPVASPWYGSIWERSIQTVKNCLKKSIGRRQISLFELMTLLCEVENVVNNRPLTYVGDSLDEPEPLTPNHLLKGEATNLLPEFCMRNDSDPDWTVESNELQIQFQKISEVKEIFKTKWEQEYLTSLRDKHKRTYGKEWNNSIKVGDVVLIHSNLPRQFWALGRVSDLKPGDDGVVRVCELQTKSGKTTRNITLLYPLESPDIIIRKTKRHFVTKKCKYLTNSLNDKNFLYFNKHKSTNLCNPSFPPLY